MSNAPPVNGEYSSKPLISNGRSPTRIKKPSYSQFPVPPGAPPWRDGPPQHQLSRSRTMQEKKGNGENGRISPCTLSVAAEFSLKRANRQLEAMGETLESAKSELSSPASAAAPAYFRTHSRSSSEPISPVAKMVPRSADGYSR